MAKKTEKTKRRFEHLKSTVAVEISCRCGGAVLAAYDDGSYVRVDKKALNPRTEFMVILAGARTFTRRPHGYGLALRDENEIRAGLYPGETIHQEHHCRKKERTS